MAMFVALLAAGGGVRDVATGTDVATGAIGVGWTFWMAPWVAVWVTL